MNAFEQKLLAALPSILAIAEDLAPLFIHSSKATIVLKASEEFAGAAVQQFAQASAQAPKSSAVTSNSAASVTPLVPKSETVESAAAQSHGITVVPNSAQ